MEEWIKENDMTGGPQGVLDTFVLMVNETRASTNMRMQVTQQMENLRGLAFEFIGQHELNDEWNEFLKTKEETKDDVQEQETEEVPQEEAESGEEVVEAPEESKKDKKE